VTVRNAVEFAGTETLFHVTRLELSVPPFEADTNVTWDGRSSVTVTPFAALKVLLVMPIVYVRRSPRLAVVLLSVLEMVRITDELLEELELELEDEELLNEESLLLELAEDKLELEEELEDEEIELLEDELDVEDDELELTEELLEELELELEEELIDEELLLLVLEEDELETEDELEDEVLELLEDETEEDEDELELDEEELPEANICLLMKTMPVQRPAETFTVPFSGVTSNWRHSVGTTSLTLCVPGRTLSNRARPFALLNAVCTPPSRTNLNCGVTGYSFPFMS